MERIVKKYLRYRIEKKIPNIGKNIDIYRNVHFKNPEYIRLGNNIYLAGNIRIEAWDRYNETTYNPQIIIGDNVKINEFCHIGCINKVEIGNDCLIGSHVLIIDHSHGCNRIEELIIHPAWRDLYSKGPVTIGERVWLCDKVTILPGVSIGDGSIIGANSVVTKDIPSKCIAAGIPAKIIKFIE